MAIWVCSFFKSSCDLYAHAKTHQGEILPADQVKLPGYVTEGFEEWLEHREDERQHWSKPYLQAAPYSEQTAVFLQLPGQEFYLEIHQPEFRYEVSWPGLDAPEVIDCQWFRRRINYSLESGVCTIREPVSNITIALIAQDADGQENVLRRWLLPLLPEAGNIQLVAFDETGRILPQGIALPPEKLILLLPRTININHVGEVDQWESCTALIGNWSEWKMEAWDLSKAFSIEIKGSEDDINCVIPIQGIVSQPDLVNGHLFQFHEQTLPPLYTGQLPSLKIPITSEINVLTLTKLKAHYQETDPDFISIVNSLRAETPGYKSNLEKWQVHLRSLGESIPHVDNDIDLIEYLDSMDMTDERTFLPLAAVLNDEVAGTFELTIRGPRDIKANFKFRFWPKLILDGHDMRLRSLSSEKTDQRFVLHLQPDAQVVTQSGVDGVIVEKMENDWAVKAPSEANRVLLDLLCLDKNGDLARVPIMIPLPRLRWGLATENFQSVVSMNAELINRSIDLLRQAGSSALHVEMYGLGDNVKELKLRLMDASNEETEIQLGNFTKTDFSKDRLRIGLGPFGTAINAIESIARFELVWQQNYSTPPVYILLLELNRELEVSNVRIEQVSPTTWKLLWVEEHTLKHRRVLLLPPWQPWNQPWEIRIPDKARGEFLLENIKLPISRYHIYFYIAPSWANKRIEAPKNINPFTVDLCDPLERFQTISSPKETPEEQFKQAIESAAIYQSLNNIPKYTEMLTVAAKQVIHLSDIPLVLSVSHWLFAQEDKNSGVEGFFLRALYHQHLISKVLEIYDPNDKIVAAYFQYLEQAKKLLTVESACILLNKMDEANVVNICAENLYQRKDAKLIDILVSRVKHQRNTNEEIFRLLNNDSEWVLGHLELCDSDPITDRFLAFCLEQSGLEKFDYYLLNKPQAIQRVLPFIKSRRNIQQYYWHEYETKGWLPLMDVHEKGILIEEDIIEIISHNPMNAWDSLHEIDQHPSIDFWINRLAHFFPKELFLIAEAAKLDTPFGIVSVIEILDPGGNKLQFMEWLNNETNTVNAWLGENEEVFLIHFDYAKREITVDGYEEVYKCFNSGMYYPEKWKLLLRRYANQNIYKVPLPINFKSTDIKFI